MRVRNDKDQDTRRTFHPHSHTTFHTWTIHLYTLNPKRGTHLQRHSARALATRLQHRPHRLGRDVGSDDEDFSAGLGGGNAGACKEGGGREMVDWWVGTQTTAVSPPWATETPHSLIRKQVPAFKQPRAEEVLFVIAWKSLPAHL